MNGSFTTKDSTVAIPCNCGAFLNHSWTIVQDDSSENSCTLLLSCSKTSKITGLELTFPTSANWRARLEENFVNSAVQRENWLPLAQESQIGARLPKRGRPVGSRNKAKTTTRGRAASTPARRSKSRR